MSTRGPSERGRRAFERIEQAQARSLEHFSHEGAERALLFDLLEASCLLELAKIEPTSLDAIEYTQWCVDVLAQIYPISGCAATTVDRYGRTVEVHSGTLPDLGGRFPFVVGETVVGALITGVATECHGPDDDFFERAASFIARGIATSLEAERLRREAATANASRIASEIHDDVLRRLEELVRALADFPGAIAAELVVDHAVIGPPVKVAAGNWGDDGHIHAVSNVAIELARVGNLVGRLRSDNATEVDAEPLRAVLESLSGSLDRIAATHQLREEAEIEPLSGLGNRRRLDRVLDAAITRARWFGEHIAVLFIDVDRLKDVNDLLGHEAGDNVIVACADALRERVRQYDECIRLGGDEFVVVAPVPDVLDALELADGIRATLRLRCAAVLPDEWALSATIGIALFPDSGREPESLLRAADAALYRANRDGRDGVVVAEPTDEPVGAVRHRRFLRRSGA